MSTVPTRMYKYAFGALLLTVSLLTAYTNIQP
ncbi:hypothetical protein ABH899_005030 [Paenibacillus sp. RC84]